MEAQNNQSEIRKGILSLAVLKIISKGKVYASEILDTLVETEFTAKEGTLYPLLGKLRRDGMIEHEWLESKSGPPRKYFVLSPEGQKYLKDQIEYLNKLIKEIEELGATK